MAVQVVILCLSSRRALQHHSHPLLRVAAVALWFLILANITSWILGSMGIPVVTILFLIALIVFFIRSRVSEVPVSRQRSLKKQTSIVDVMSDSIMELSFVGTDHLADIDSGVGEEEDAELAMEEPEVISSSYELQEPSQEQPSVQFSMLPDRHTQMQETSPSAPLTEEEKKDEEVDIRSVRPRNRRRAVTQLRHPEAQAIRANRAKKLSNQLFLLLFTCCMVVILWHHPLMLLLLAPVALWSTLKKLSAKFSITFQSAKLLKSTKDTVMSWMDSHLPIVFPQPIPTLYNMYLRLDKWVLHLGQELVGRLVSACMITGMLVGSVGLSIFLVAQIHLEMTNAVGLTVQVLNSSVMDNPWIHRFVKPLARVILWHNSFFSLLIWSLVLLVVWIMPAVFRRLWNRLLIRDFIMAESG